ncbi:spore coat U domain-containing protein [Cupriavidus sp. CV2]|uniref:Csu type fimbrial protein n=1 Tax=Cupriavidus ulmosensis TaxID=3065913 RepID=UPI00296AA869|nr:spore coat U domain-containing protein [Cupriavidus sp. CV2]MDW3686168.1 spore coat U domain-containing protein [Cupriavidus sp. CV2]
MKTSTTRKHAIALLLLAATLPLGAHADTRSVTLDISMSVTADCLISATPLNFGTGSVMQTAVTQQANLSVTCTNTVPYQVALDEGTVPGSTVTNRLMAGTGANTIGFNVYRDAAYTQVWGKTVETDTYAGTGNGAAQSIPLYGQITKTMIVGSLIPDSYATTLTATLSF